MRNVTDFITSPKDGKIKFLELSYQTDYHMLTTVSM